MTPNPPFRAAVPPPAPHARRMMAKRAGVILAAVAVPALAAPGSFGAKPEPEAARAQPMGFETPGESFPGSAFYYLEDAPALGDGAVAGRAVVAAQPAALVTMAAPVLRIAGSDSDHARAQRCMTQAIYYEAASESDAGQRAVAQVVLNRVAHPAWPNTVCGVVYQGSERTTGCQFSFTCDGSLARQPSTSFWNRASRIAREALAGAVYAPAGLATHYHTLAVHPYWADSLDRVTTIGAHQFYRWRGAAGSRVAFSMRYGGGEPMPGRTFAGPPAPDPLAPTMAGLAGDQPVMTVAAAGDFAPLADAVPLAVAAAEQTAQPADNLPGAGAVRSEYAQSGAWIARP